MKELDPSNRRCQEIGSDGVRCGASAHGLWDVSRGKSRKSNEKWLCIGHAIFWNVSRNPRIVVFE